METDDPLYSAPAHGTFVKDKAIAERMMAGSQRHLATMDKTQTELRVRGIKVTSNKLRGTIRTALRRVRREQTGVTPFRGAGPVGKAAERAEARKRAEEFNAKPQ